MNNTYRVDNDQIVGKGLKHGGNTVLDLLLRGNTGRMDVVDTGADLVRITVLLESIEQLEVALGSLNGDDISIQRLDGGEDIVEVGVTEVRVGLKSIGDTSGSELEGGNGPAEVLLPVSLAERKL